MKMKYEDLARLKIDIQTSNDKNFLELAILFDKPEFLAYLPKIRKRYDIEKPIKSSEYRQVLDRLENSKETKFDFSIYENARQLIDFIDDNAVWGNDIEHELDNNYRHIVTDANILCYLFHRPPFFADAIEEVIFYGSVDGDNFKATSYAVVENDMISSTPAYFQLPQAAILITPTSTDNEIKEQAQKIRGMYQSDKRLSYYAPRIDKVNQIRLYREWYWKSISGKRNQEILDDWTNNLDRDQNSDMDESRISKGISYYKKLLLI